MTLDLNRDELAILKCVLLALCNTRESLESRLVGDSITIGDDLLVKLQHALDLAEREEFNWPYNSKPLG
jgi:hypothetical protein